MVKAKNIIDNNLYAIKKIPLRRKREQRLLREVLALSRLHHTYIVRYPPA